MMSFVVELSLGRVPDDVRRQLWECLVRELATQADTVRADLELMSSHVDAETAAAHARLIAGIGEGAARFTSCYDPSFQGDLVSVGTSVVSIDMLYGDESLVAASDGGENMSFASTSERLDSLLRNVRRYPISETDIDVVDLLK